MKQKLLILGVSVGLIGGLFVWNIMKSEAVNAYEVEFQKTSSGGLKIYSDRTGVMAVDTTLCPPDGGMRVANLDTWDFERDRLGLDEPGVTGAYYCKDTNDTDGVDKHRLVVVIDGEYSYEIYPQDRRTGEFKPAEEGSHVGTVSVKDYDPLACRSSGDPGCNPTTSDGAPGQPKPANTSACSSTVDPNCNPTTSEGAPGQPTTTNTTTAPVPTSPSAPGTNPDGPVEEEEEVAEAKCTGTDCCGDVKTSIIRGSLCGTDEKDANTSTVFALLKGLLRFMTAGVAIAAVGGIGYGALLYTTAESKPEQTKKAIGVITNVVIGLVAYALMGVLLNFIIPGGVFS